MNLFTILKEVEKLGYIILTYEEAREELGVIPENVSKVYFTLICKNKKYLIFDKKENEINFALQVFLKREKIKLIKTNMFKILEKNKGVL